jgi:glycyl-tRNA synthetase
MEIEFFCKPGTDAAWLEYWVQQRLNWYTERLGIKKENLRLRQHGDEELAHYSSCCYDIEYLYPIGWSELEGIANRGDYDLRQHAEFSGKSLTILDDETNQHIVPYVIEPSAGVDRSVLAVLCDAYDEEPDKDEIRVVLHFHPDIAPVKAAVLPLSKKETLTPLAKDIARDLRPCGNVQYDDTQSIGRRYRRQDELGTPFCVTVDFQSLEDNQVTIRERDSMHQIRVPVKALRDTLLDKLAGEEFLKVPKGGTVVIGGAD